MSWSVSTDFPEDIPVKIDDEQLAKAAAEELESIGLAEKEGEEMKKPAKKKRGRKSRKEAEPAEEKTVTFAEPEEIKPAPPKEKVEMPEPEDPIVMSFTSREWEAELACADDAEALNFRIGMGLGTIAGISIYMLFDLASKFRPF